MTENKRTEELTPLSIIFHYDIIEKFFGYYMSDKYSNRDDFVNRTMIYDNISTREAIIIWQAFDMAFGKLT